MATWRKVELDHRLEAYFATVRSPSLREAIKRRAGNWQIYAAVTGSAMAMATGASASVIGDHSREIAPEPLANILTARPNPETSPNIPLANAVRLAVAS